MKLLVSIATAVALTVMLLLSSVAANAQEVLSSREEDSIRALLPSLTDVNQIIKAHYLLSRKCVEMDTIIKYALSAYYLAKRHNNPEYVAASCEVIAWYYNTIGSFSLTSKYFREAGDIYEAQGNVIGQAMMLSGTGDAYIGMGKFEEGINCKLQAIKLFDEHHDLASAALIYRTIGKSCTEFQQYKPAMEYLDRALHNDLEVDNQRGIGRDYYYLGLNFNLYSTRTSNGSQLLAKDYFLKALNIQKEGSDEVFIIKCCAMLSLIYNDLHIASSNWDYVDSSYYYYNMGMRVVEQNGYHADDDLYEIARAEHTMFSGNYVSALQIFQQKIQKEDLSNVTLMLLNRAFLHYYDYNNDFKGLLDLSDRIERERKKIYITEFALGISKLNNAKALEDQLASLYRSAKNRERNFEITKAQLTFLRAIIIVFLVFAAAMIALFSYRNVKNKQYSILLREQTAEIEAANEELHALMNEAQKQSELISRQTVEMKRQRNKLASINIRIIINLDIASRFQASLMPSQEKMKSIFKNIFVLWRPLEEVSGDFYWGTEAGGLKFVAVADCTGHGIPGASLSMLGISFLNSIVARIDRNHVNAAEVLTKLRNRIVKSLTRGSINNEDIHDGMDIAVCIFDTANSKLSYAGAYRPLWIVNGGQLTEYKADKMPVAVDHDRDSDFTNHEINIQSGDRVYLFSDGITDQFGEREPGKFSKLKPKRLRELLCNIYDHPAEQQKAEVLSMIDDWRGVNEQTDDMIMVGIVVNE